MDHDLSNPSLLKPENLDYQHLTLSLLQEGMRAGLISPDQVQQIQLQLMEFLSATILKYTHKESSSVKTETAESLMLSILYTTDFHLRRLSSPTLALQHLLDKTISELYHLGLELIQSEVELASKLLQEVRTTRIPVPLPAYNLTIDGGMDEFFLNYDVRFEAHYTPSDIDYPLMTDDMSQTGIIYIKAYLEHLLLENQLCRQFSRDYLHRLLRGYGQKYNLAPEDLLVNIPELILRNALCSILVGKGADSLTLDNGDCQRLTSRLQGYPPEQYQVILTKALEELFSRLTITNPTVRHYWLSFIERFSQELLKAVKDHTLTGLIVLESDTYPINRVYYQTGTQLSDEELRQVIYELKECSNGTRKADLIQAEIHNLNDLIEVFNAWCIFDTEYTEIFQRLGDFELAFMVKVLGENTLQDQLEHNWQAELLNYLQTIEVERSKKITELVPKLKLT